MTLQINPAYIRKSISKIAVDVDVERFKPGSYDEHGRWIEPEQAVEKLKVKASVQVARSHDLNRVEEGLRTKAAIKLYTVAKLKTASENGKTQPDIIVWQGKRYQVESVDDWLEVGEYYKVIAIKIEE